MKVISLHDIRKNKLHKRFDLCSVGLCIAGKYEYVYSLDAIYINGIIILSVYVSPSNVFSGARLLGSLLTRKRSDRFRRNIYVVIYRRNKIFRNI